MQGRKCALTPELEEKFLTLLKKMEKMGMGPTIREFQEIVCEYITANEIATPFTDNRPGPDWVANFLKRHNLALKKGGQMQLARKALTSDPFVIFGYYDKLEVIKDLGIENRPECIYNLDETGFPTDPSKRLTIGTKGSKTVRLTHGASRENITVLAICCADGSCFDPLIVFKGKKMQSNWCGEEALPGVQYAVSENGWMTSGIFEDFFKTFAEKTAGIRPLLLILDGHLSHTTLNTVELAIKEDITILMLPPHCTDLLQPLDIPCFAPLKSRYESELTDFVHKTAAREPLRKAGFVNMLCRVWKQGLSIDNIKAGFRATGIVPIDKSKYNIDRLDPIKLETYKKWVDNGKPQNDNNEPILNHQEKNDSQLDTTAEVLSLTPDSSLVSSTPTHSFPPSYQIAQPGCSSWASPNCSPSPSPHRSVYDILDELKSYAPKNMGILQFVHELEIKKRPKLSVEEVLLSRGKSAEITQKQKRHNIPMTAQVITHKECVEEKRKRESKGPSTHNKKKKTENKQIARKKSKSLVKKVKKKFG